MMLTDVIKTANTRLLNSHHRGARPSNFSSKSFASLILLARYGDPPRSGWFAIMICRWASFSLFRSCALSLKIIRKRSASLSKREDRAGRHGREAQDRDRLLPVHLRLEPALHPLLRDTAAADDACAHEVPPDDGRADGAEPDEDGGRHERCVCGTCRDRDEISSVDIGSSGTVSASASALSASHVNCFCTPCSWRRNAFKMPKMRQVHATIFSVDALHVGHSCSSHDA